MESSSQIIGALLMITAMYLPLHLMNRKFSHRLPLWLGVPLTLILLFAGFIYAAFAYATTVDIVLIISVIYCVYAFVCLRGPLQQRAFWVFMSILMYMGGTLIGTLCVAAIVDRSNISFDFHALPGNAISVIFQSVTIFFVTRKRNDVVKLSPLSMTILILVPLLSCTMLAVLDMFILMNEGSEHMRLLESIFFVFIALINMGLFLLYGHMSSLTIQTHEQRVELQRTALQTTQYKEISTLYQETRVWRHDFHNHMYTIKGLVDIGNYDALSKYLDNITETASRINFLIKTGNDMFDAVVSTKIYSARSMGIRFDAESCRLADLDIDPIDLTSLIGNLLDNAIEACERVEDASARAISLRIFNAKGQLGISIDNSTDGQVKTVDGRYLSTKKHGDHSIGMRRIDSIVSKYNGFIERSIDGTTFKTKIGLPMRL